MTTFSEKAWAETSELRAAIDALPFNRELAAGTLSEERFRHYMIQDALYLEDYSRALAAAAVTAPDSDARCFFAAAAEEAIVVERALHAGFFEKFGITPGEARAADKSPTCAAYTDFLLAMAHAAGYAELVAAILPCFWIYWDVGKTIAAQSATDNPYAAWIETYSDPAFGEQVEAAIAIADRTAQAASEGEAARMMAAFTRSTQYEWMFWDAAYRLEAWPIGA
ncbi:MAG: thiaminase II [Alphaproteobacteria bacterium]|nr:thiaminase II [Alphaproteobacteria bacterium]